MLTAGTHSGDFFTACAHDWWLNHYFAMASSAPFSERALVAVFLSEQAGRQCGAGFPKSAWEGFIFNERIEASFFVFLALRESEF